MHARHRFVAIELRDELVGALGEQLAVAVGPPAVEVALGVELAARVIVAVHHLVADHRADAAVVERRVGLRVEERRLQDRRREHDLVLGGVVVGVDGLRGHAPLGAIDRLTDLVQAVAVVERLRRFHVGEETGIGGLQATPVTPLVRVADLRREAGPLLQRALLGLRAHPVQLLQPRLQRDGEVVHQLLHLHLRLRREGGLHIELAQALTHRVVHRFQAALPARQHVLLAAQGLVVELEVRLLEGLRQVRRRLVEGMEAQVGLPRRRRGIGEHLVQLGEVARLGERELVLGRHLQGVEEGVPVEVRGDRVGLRGAHRVVALGRVAQFDARQRGIGQAGLECHHRLGLGGGLRRLGAAQLQHAGDVLHVGVADLGLRFVEVVALLRQAQAALAGVGDDLAGILVVGIGAEREQEALALRVALAQPCGDGLAVAQAVDGLQLRLQRRQAGLVDGGLVHAGAPDVGDLAFDAAGRRVGRGGLLDQRVLDHQRAFGQHFEAAPAGAVGRHRVGLEPLGVDEAVEVVAGGDGRVEVGQVEGDLGRIELGDIQRGRAGGGRLGGGGGLGLRAMHGQRQGDRGGQGDRDESTKGHAGRLRTADEEDSPA